MYSSVRIGSRARGGGRKGDAMAGMGTLPTSAQSSRIATSRLINVFRQGTASYPERSRRAAVPFGAVSSHSPLDTRHCSPAFQPPTSNLEPPPSTASRLQKKGCQPLLAVSRRKPLKTHGRSAKRASRICVANSAPNSLSTRQCVPSRIRSNFLKTNNGSTSYTTVAPEGFRGTSYPDFARRG